MNECRIYKAKVTSIESREDGKNEIYVTPLQSVGDTGVQKLANPPSVVPTSQVGSGMISMPDPGTICIVAEEESSYKVDIIGYTHPDGFNPFGALSGEPTTPGSFYLKAGGMNKAVFSMDRAGTVRMFSNMFAQIEVKGTRKQISMKSKRYSNEFAGGKIETSFRPEDADTGISDFVTHKQVYSKSTENPGFSDREHFETEVPVKPAPTHPYVDKAIVRAGQIKNLARSEMMSHVYQIETRQHTAGNAVDKDTVTNFRLGYQDGFFKYGIDDYYPAGTLVDVTAKRNNPQDFQSFVFRVGRYEGDVASREPTQGEVFRQQILYNKLDKVPYGSPITNPVGDGKGYHYKFDDSDFGQQYTISYGKLDSSRASDELSGSIKRTHLHQQDLAGNKLAYSSIVGGENIFKEQYLDQTPSSTQKVTELWKSGGDYSKQWVWDEIQASMTFNKDGLKATYSASQDTSIEIYDKKIVIKTPNMNLELSDEKGLQLNGVPLVYGNFVDFFNDMKSQLILGNMGTLAPFSPGAQTKHQQGYNADFQKQAKQAFHTGENN